jgi:hypothetical protein
MYLSHPVRRMRDDPREDAETTLVVRVGESASVASLSKAIGVAGGTVEEELPYGALRVTIPQERIADLCSLDGIDSIETDDVVGIGGDAGEDLG